MFLLKLFSGILLMWDVVAATHVTPPPLTEHPPVSNVRVVLINKTAVRVQWEKPPNIVNHYIQYYQLEVRQTLHEMLMVHLKHVKPPVDHEVVNGILPEILYNLKVAIIYTDKSYIFSSELHFRTDNPNVTSYCLCDSYGSKNSSYNNGTCKPNTVGCQCLDKYTGSHCALCSAGHYRELYRPCKKCPCKLQVSNGECVFDTVIRRTRCVKCKKLRDGPLCEICALGYFRHPEKESECIKCSCPPVGSRPGHCDFLTGYCSECPNGTAGKHCERCAPGWPSCHLARHALLHHSGLTLMTSVLVVLAVAVALGLGYWVMRLRARQKRLNAWSLELNRYELDHPGIVDSGSQSGLMMEEAVPAYGGAADVTFDGAATAGVSEVGPPNGKDDQLIFRAARLQLRQAEPNALADPRKGGPLV